MKPKAAAVVALAAFVAACGSPRASDAATAAEIERQVVAAHPGITLKRYARFYAREADGSVSGRYLFANEGYEPPEGKAGRVAWTTAAKLPIVEDGGCAVITVRYDPDQKRLTAFECNADVMDGPAIDPQVVRGHR